MEKIIQNKKMNIVCEDTDIDEIENRFKQGECILYVEDKKGEYLGCITRRELLAGLKQKCLTWNCNSYKIMHGEGEERRAKEIFDIHNNIYNLPVIDKNGLLLYEYVREIDEKSFDSTRYWENRYKTGGNSGDGSYDKLAEFKATVVNDFIRKNSVTSVIEWGFGDGNQVDLLDVPMYTGYDVSETAREICLKRFWGDNKKRFIHYDGSRMNGFDGIYDMALSLDVLYHLVEDNKYEDYLYNLFHSSDKYVCIYSSNYEERQKAEHIKRRKFTDYIKEHFSQWEMILFVENPYLYTDSNSNFYFFKKNSESCLYSV